MIHAPAQGTMRTLSLTIALILVLDARLTYAHTFTETTENCTWTYGEHCTTRPTHPVEECRAGHRITDCNCFPAGCVTGTCVADIPNFRLVNEAPENGLDDDCDGTVDNLELAHARHSSGWGPAVAYQSRVPCCDWFLVAWTDETSGNVMAEMVLANGFQTFLPERVSMTRAIDAPALPAALTNPPVVIWATAAGIRGRVLNETGSVNSARPVFSLDETQGTYASPKIAKMSHNASDYLVTWLRDATVFGRILQVRPGRCTDDTKECRFDEECAAGEHCGITVAGDPIKQISPSGAATLSADVVFNYLTPSDVEHTNPGQYFVVWNTGSGIRGQFVKQNGDLGQAVQVSTGSAFDFAPVVAFGPESARGQLFVVWSRGLNQTQILAQRVNSDGTLEGPVITVDNAAAVNGKTPINGTPKVSYSLALGQYLVTWGRREAPEASAEVHPVGRMVNLDGSIVRDRFVINDGPVNDPRGGDPVTAALEPSSALQNAGTAVGGATIFGYAVVWRSTTQKPGGNLGFRVVDRHLDTDGDALLDDWETGFVDVNNDGVFDNAVDLDLRQLDPAKPPHRLRKDVYLEIDWMDCALGGCAAGDTHSHRLRDLDGDGVPEVARLMMETYGKDQSPASVHNPDSSFNGIVLHVDHGQMGGGAAVVHAPDVPANSRQTGLDSRRRRVFHYGLATHQCCGAADLPGSFYWAGRGGEETSVDVARGIAAHTFMHELGHTLGLTHGGVDSINYKPNYLSIMNYAFSGSLPTLTGPTVLDYSRAALPSLDENGKLDESLGLRGDASSPVQTFHRCPLIDPKVLIQTRMAPITGAINWSCNRDTAGVDIIDSGTVSVSIDGNYVRDKDEKLVLDANGKPQPILETLNGGDDWSRMFFNFRVVGNFGAAAELPPLDDLPTPEQIRESTPQPSIAVSFEPKSPPHGRPFIFWTVVTNAGPGVAKNVRLRVAGRKHSAEFDLETMMAGDTVRREIAFDVPPACNARSIVTATVTSTDVLNASVAPVVRSGVAAYCTNPNTNPPPIGR